jgi:predicted PhzF superfamily epimerase YddE/YHI9
VLTARRNGKLIELDFPADSVTEAPAPPDIVQAIGAKPIFICKGGEDYLIEIDNEDKLRSLSVDLEKLKKIPSRGFIVTAKAAAGSEGYDFVSRFFAPLVGIDEDPVTGSAHCTLAGFWGEKLGKSEMIGYQASVRGGYVNVRLGDNRVTLGGCAVTVYAAHLEG